MQHELGLELCPETISPDGIRWSPRPVGRWSEAEKHAVVAEAERPGVNIWAVARRHGIKPSPLFRWRRLARDGLNQQTMPAFVAVSLALPAAETPVQTAVAKVDAAPISPPTAASPEPDTQRIEIALGNGRVVRVGAGIDVRTVQ
jgi:transposase